VCGIIGFALTKPVPMDTVFKALVKLETHQYPQEPRPVGGYGAGIAILKDDKIEFRKVGKVGDSPARHLSSIVNIAIAQVLVGHVRMPSPQFMEKARFSETAQPYAARCNRSLTVVSVHNGYVANYVEIKQKLGKKHVFESSRIELVDSEVIPHIFEQYLKEKESVAEALDALYSVLKGSSAIAILQSGNKGKFLHLIHKGGETRGLCVWRNGQNETVFCSRKEPIIEEFNNVLTEHGFEERIFIPYHEDESLKLSFQISETAHA
jgi:glucosamine--fructose-6-phosphate aminotransferase (isomerizing)